MNAMKEGTEKELRVMWLEFYSKFLLPFWVLTTFIPTGQNYLDTLKTAALSGIPYERIEVTFFQGFINPYTAIFLTLMNVFICVLVYGLIKRTYWAWSYNWLFLILKMFSGIDPKKDLVVNIGTTIAVALLFCLPNAIYFWKRRSLFVNQSALA